jgi:Lon protease-like protein
VVLERLVPGDHPYLTGEVRELPDRDEVQVPGGADLDRLRALVGRYAEALGTLNDVDRDPEFSDAAALLTFQVAALLEWDHATKQHFLAIRSPGERVARLLHVLPGLLTALEHRAAVHRRAPRNGTGPG